MGEYDLMLETQISQLENRNDQLQARIAALEADNARLRTHGQECQDLALEHYGLLLCIGSWLNGHLPEATREQFLKAIAAAKQPSTLVRDIARRALESENPDAN